MSRGKEHHKDGWFGAVLCYNHHILSVPTGSTFTWYHKSMFVLSIQYFDDTLSFFLSTHSRSQKKRNFAMEILQKNSYTKNFHVDRCSHFTIYLSLPHIYDNHSIYLSLSLFLWIIEYFLKNQFNRRSMKAHGTNNTAWIWLRKNQVC